MEFLVKRIDNGALQEAAYTVRKEVFVKEQNVPDELELDEFDEAAETIHIAAQTEDGAVIGTARIRPADQEGTAKVERVAVLPAMRKNGIGRSVMKFLEEEAAAAGFEHLKLNAQTHAQQFYEQLGYVASGDLFLEAGIEHITMYKVLK